MAVARIGGLERVQHIEIPMLQDRQPRLVERLEDAGLDLPAGVLHARIDDVVAASAGEQLLPCSVALLSYRSWRTAIPVARSKGPARRGLTQIKAYAPARPMVR
jgi:hypothetical protein